MPNITRPVIDPPSGPPDIHRLNASLYTLARVCADALAKSVQHFQADGVWLIGTMPPYAADADLVESQARALLAHSQLNGPQIDLVTRSLRDSADLRAVARSARHAAQISWLIRQEVPEADIDPLFALVRCVGEPAVVVGRKSVLAIASQNSQAATWAALHYRDIDACRRASESALREPDFVKAYSAGTRRMTVAALWYMAIAGENMARLSARAAAAHTSNLTGRA
jgi:hypothetical protein